MSRSPHTNQCQEGASSQRNAAGAKQRAHLALRSPHAHQNQECASSERNAAVAKQEKQKSYLALLHVGKQALALQQRGIASAAVLKDGLAEGARSKLPQLLIRDVDLVVREGREPGPHHRGVPLAVKHTRQHNILQRRLGVKGFS